MTVASGDSFPRKLADGRARLSRLDYLRASERWLFGWAVGKAVDKSAQPSSADACGSSLRQRRHRASSKPPFASCRVRKIHVGRHSRRKRQRRCGRESYSNSTWVGPMCLGHRPVGRSVTGDVCRIGSGRACRDIGPITCAPFSVVRGFGNKLALMAETNT